MTKGAFAASGAGGVLGFIGAVELVARGPAHASGWMWVAAGCLVLFVAQIWAVQQALEQREKARASGGSITGVDIGEGAFFGGQISMHGNVWGVGPRQFLKRRKRRRHWWHRLTLDAREQRELAMRGRELGSQLLAFAAERRSTEPPFFVARNLPPAEAEACRASYDALREQHWKETRAEHLQRFAGEIAEWLDDVDAYGFPLSEDEAELSPTWYMTVAGAMPIEETGRAIRVLSHRIERERPSRMRLRTGEASQELSN